jgi:O-antigen ligase
LHTFLENPILGVGVGQSSAFRTSEFGRNVATHTEYTRIISEHGMLGLISFLFLLLAYGRAFVRNRHIFARSISLAFSLWAFACMSHAAMRIALIPLILGLAMASYNLTDENINSVQ